MPGVSFFCLCIGKLVLTEPCLEPMSCYSKYTRYDNHRLLRHRHTDSTIQQSITRSKIDPKLVGDICVGTVLTPDAMYAARSAALAAGFPDTTPVEVVNRFCSSGLMAVSSIANQIHSGSIEIGLAVGVESMSEKFVVYMLRLMRFSLIFFSCIAQIKAALSKVNLFPVILPLATVRNAWGGRART